MKPSRHLALIISTAALILTACEKKEQTPSPHKHLTPPEKSFSPKQPALPVEAEVTASKLPIQLTLRLYKKHLKATDEYGGPSLWYQIELKNIGDQKKAVTDEVFYNPGAINHARVGIYLEVIGPDGKEPDRRESGERDIPFECLPQAEIDEALERSRLLEKWRASGISGEELALKLSAWMSSRNEKQSDNFNYLSIMPGESTRTPPWKFQTAWDYYCERKPAPQGMGQFAELVYYDLSKTGTYQVRAIYNHLPSKTLRNYNERHHRRFDDHQIMLKTPYLKFIVLP